MNPTTTGLNGFHVHESGNFIWSGALSLAWRKLKSEIIQDEIQMDTNEASKLQVIDNFNNCPFTFQALSDESYYSFAGFGDSAIEEINTSVKNKFPAKTFDPLKYGLSDTDFIAYAYLFKEIEFKTPFEKNKMNFGKNKVAGFMGKSQAQKKQVMVYQYENEDNFLIELTTTSNSDQIFVLKSQTMLELNEIVKLVEEAKPEKSLTKRDIFKMPCVELDQEKRWSEVEGLRLKNEKFENYCLAEVYEKFKFKLNEKGAKVENEGVIKSKGCIAKATQIRKIIVNKPFWIIMKERQKHPYMIIHINQL